jgi:hypothetical protein
MKTWFAKLRISAAFDSGRPLPRWLRRRLSSSEELRNFARQVSELDSALRESGPAQTPDALHGSIMRKVRRVERERSVAPRQRSWLRWLPVPAMGILLLCAVWVRHSQSSNRALPSLTVAFDAGETITETLPTQLINPLKEEWQRVNLDVENTTRFLLATVPF